jgi:hypothetical protein
MAFLSLRPFSSFLAMSSLRISMDSCKASIMRVRFFGSVSLAFSLAVLAGVSTTKPCARLDCASRRAMSSSCSVCWSLRALPSKECIVKWQHVLRIMPSDFRIAASR